jgi:hypothetical protein
MKQKIALALATLLAVPALAAEAPMAVLEHANGTVLVNQGETFVTASEGQALNPGDRLLVMAGSEAALAFADGCALPVAGGSLLEVPEASPCAGASVNLQKVQPLVAQAETESEEGESGEAAKKPANTGAIVAVVGGVALIAVAGGGGSDNDRPVSP